MFCENVPGLASELTHLDELPIARENEWLEVNLYYTVHAFNGDPPIYHSTDCITSFSVLLFIYLRDCSVVLLSSRNGGQQVCKHRQQNVPPHQYYHGGIPICVRRLALGTLRISHSHFAMYTFSKVCHPYFYTCGRWLLLVAFQTHKL